MRRPLRNAVAALIVALAVASCAKVRARAPVVTTDGVRFTFRQQTARSVAVAGTFNDWSVSMHPLQVQSDGLWAAVVSLPVGEHLFMFVVNGTEWITPPLAEDFVDDGFGVKNGVVIVRPRER